MGTKENNGKRHTYYQKEWEDASIQPEISKWVSGTAGGTGYSCRICGGKSRQLGNMGVTALTKHQVGAIHQKKADSMALAGLQQPSIASLTTKSSATVTSSSTKQVQQTLNIESLQAKKTSILLVIKSVMSHISQRCLEELVDLFPILFPDSAIPGQLQLKRTKIGYMITFGLAVHFQKIVMDTLIPDFGARLHFVSCYDEAWNPISKRKQMDLHVIYFDEKEVKVKRSYIGSTFMGHATADDSLEHLKKVHGNLDLHSSLISVSMDGPHVNWKTLRVLDAFRKGQNPECHGLLVIGSCGLHVLHGAYGTAQTATGWKLDRYFKDIYSIFKISSAKREDYLVANGHLDDHEGKETNYLFPQKFCGHRWLENGPVIKRAISILPLLKQYLKYLQEKNKFPKKNKDERFHRIRDKQGNRLLLAEVEFSLFINNQIEPFLTFFQAERPLAVFLFGRLKKLLSSLLDKFVKPALLDGSTVKEMLKIDLEKVDNLLPLDKINVGHGADRVLKKTTTVQTLEVKKFRQSVRDFFKALIRKLAERSPLNYSLTLYISSLAPNQITASEDKSFVCALFSKLCRHLLDKNLVTVDCADRAEASFKELVKSPVALQKLADFDEFTERLDDLYFPLVKNHRELRAVVKIVLIISHGNARVESGFNVNKDTLIDNLKERSLVGQRIVYDYISNIGVENLSISKSMLRDVDEAHKRYVAHLEEERQRQTAGEKRKQEMRQLSTEIKNAKAAKASAQEEFQKKTVVMESKISLLEEEMQRNK